MARIGQYFKEFFNLWLYWFIFPLLKPIEWLMSAFNVQYELSKGFYLGMILLGFLIANIKLVSDKQARIEELEDQHRSKIETCKFCRGSGKQPLSFIDSLGAVWDLDREPVP